MYKLCHHIYDVFRVLLKALEYRYDSTATTEYTTIQVTNELYSDF